MRNILEEGEAVDIPINVPIPSIITFSMLNTVCDNLPHKAHIFSVIFYSIFSHISLKEGSIEVCSRLMMGILVSELIYVSALEDKSSTTV